MQGYVATHATSPATRKLNYDPIKDFTPVGMIGGTPNVLVVPATFPVGDPKQFIAHVRANPGKLNYGSAGVGSLTHMTMDCSSRPSMASSCTCPTAALPRSGFPGFDAVQWYGAVGPAGLPPEVVKLLNETLNKALTEPDMLEKLSAEAVELMPMSPARFAEYIRADLARWTQLAAQRKIQAEG
jgi:tripartite-type tricarboxylate transporter receptor subunit TctC